MPRSSCERCRTGAGGRGVGETLGVGVERGARVERAVKVGKGAKEEKEEQNVDAKPKDV